MPKPDSVRVALEDCATTRLILSFSRIGEARCQACRRTKIGSLFARLSFERGSMPFAKVSLRISRRVGVSSDEWKKPARLVTSDSPSGFLYRSQRARMAPGAAEL